MDFQGNMVGKWTNEPCSEVDEVVNHFWVLTQTELYLEYIELFFLLLSSDFHEEFAYNGQHDQRQRKVQDENESSIKEYQQADDTRWNLLQEKYKWQKV